VPVVGTLAGDAEVVDRPARTAFAVGAAEVEGAPGLVGVHRAAVAVVEIEFSVGTGVQRVQAVVVVDRVEAGEQNLAFVDGGIELQVAVDVGVGEQVRRLRHVNDVVDDRHPHRRDQSRFLHEGMRTVAAPVAVAVLENDDPVALRPRSLAAAVVHPLRDPDPSGGVDVHVGRVEQLRAGRPGGHLKRVVDEFEHLGRNRLRRSRRFPAQHAGGRNGEDEGGSGVEATHDPAVASWWRQAARIPRSFRLLTSCGLRVSSCGWKLALVPETRSADPANAPAQALAGRDSQIAERVHTGGKSGRDMQGGKGFNHAHGTEHFRPGGQAVAQDAAGVLCHRPGRTR